MKMISGPFFCGFIAENIMLISSKVLLLLIYIDNQCITTKLANSFCVKPNFFLFSLISIAFITSNLG